MKASETRYSIDFYPELVCGRQKKTLFLIIMKRFVYIRQHSNIHHMFFCMAILVETPDSHRKLHEYIDKDDIRWMDEDDLG